MKNNLEAQTQSNRESAIEFLRLVTAHQIREAYGRHIAPNFRHHNAFFRGDAESLMVAMEENASKFPHKVLTVQRAIAEGDIVIVHSKVVLQPEGNAVALVHIFRFEEGKIAELWDIAQTLPDQSPNENGMF